jgi:hypothetical protein
MPDGREVKEPAAVLLIGPLGNSRDKRMPGGTSTGICRAFGKEATLPSYSGGEPAYFALFKHGGTVTEA